MNHGSVVISEWGYCGSAVAGTPNGEVVEGSKLLIVEGGKGR